MVRGIDKFREHFTDYKDYYTIIGGTACDCLFTKEGLNPRATKDIDLLIVLEKYNPEFNKRLWEFIEAGGYKNSKREDTQKRYYRFLAPTKADYPEQLELFCRASEIIQVPSGKNITALDPSEDFHHLSVIMIDEESYQFVLANSTKHDDIPIANVEALIYLKAVAYLNFKEDERKGMEVKSEDIKKHKYDVFRLAALLSDGTVTVSDTMAEKLRVFIKEMEIEQPDLKPIYKNLRAGNLSVTEALTAIKKKFGLDD